MSGKGADRDYVGDGSQAEPKGVSQKMVRINDPDSKSQKNLDQACFSSECHTDIGHCGVAPEATPALTEPKEVSEQYLKDPEQKPQKKQGQTGLIGACKTDTRQGGDGLEAIPVLTGPEEVLVKMMVPNEPEPKLQKKLGREGLTGSWETDIRQVVEALEAVPAVIGPKEVSEKRLKYPEPKSQKRLGDDGLNGAFETDIAQVGDAPEAVTALTEPEEDSKKKVPKPKPQMNYVEDEERPCCSKNAGINYALPGISPRSIMAAERIITAEMELFNGIDSSDAASILSSGLDMEDFVLLSDCLDGLFTADEVSAFEEVIEMQIRKQRMQAPRKPKRKKKNKKETKRKVNAEYEGEDPGAPDDSGWETTEEIDDE